MKVLFVIALTLTGLNVSAAGQTNTFESALNTLNQQMTILEQTLILWSASEALNTSAFLEYYNCSKGPLLTPSANNRRDAECLIHIVREHQNRMHRGDSNAEYLATEIDPGFTPSQEEVTKCTEDLKLNKEICRLAEFGRAKDERINRTANEISGSEAAGTGSSY